VEEYVCITVRARPGESEADFAARLSRFWTQMLRSRKSDFEKVYAETTAFEREGDRWSRQYLAKAEVVDILDTELKTAGLDFAPIDRDETYSKYEAVSPEWMQIEH
jgi:hypothetical protein